MSGDGLKTTCCPDLWDRINELEAENAKLREALEGKRQYENITMSNVNVARVPRG